MTQHRSSHPEGLPMLRKLKWFTAALAVTAFAAANPIPGQSQAAGPAQWQNDLTPITPADWNYDLAAHLLERAGFSGTPEEIRALAKLTPAEAVRRLVHFQNIDNSQLLPFDESGVHDPGLEPFPPSRPAVTDLAKAKGEALGIKVKPSGNRRLQPVVNEFFYWLRASVLETNRVGYWWANRMVRTNRPLEEKMALFWHGHFAVNEAKVRDYRKLLKELQIFQTQGTGNFRDLMIAVAKDPAMLTFLDAGVNVKGAPNENFAREIMELSREVFVGSSLDVNAGVQEGQHRRILSHGDHQVPEVARPLRLENLKFFQQLPVIPDLGFVNSEMTVPEECHLLLERTVCPNHAVGPPVANTVGLEHAGAKPVEELVHDRLKTPVAAGLDLDTKGLTLCLSQIGNGRPAWRKGFQAGIVNTRLVEGQQLAVVNVLEMDQPPDRFCGSQFCQCADLLRRAAEARALQEMCCQIVVPVGRRDRREVVLPPRRPRGLRLAGNRIRRCKSRDGQCGRKPLQFAKHGKSLRM